MFNKTYGLMFMLLFVASASAGYAKTNVYFQSGNPVTNIELTIVFPTNTTFYQSDLHIALNAIANLPVTSWWYSLDSGVTNQTFTPIDSIIAENGTNYLQVWANDTVNNLGYKDLYFTIRLVSAKAASFNITQNTQNVDYIPYILAGFALIIAAAALFKNREN